jgi:hypothetical protein
MHVGNKYASKSGVAQVKFGQKVQGRVLFYESHEKHNRRQQMMTMQVQGNGFSYNHPVVFPELLKYDSVLLQYGEENNPDYNGESFALVLTVLDSFDLNATLYKRFVITKISTDDIPRVKREINAPTQHPPSTEIPFDDLYVENAEEYIPEPEKEVKFEEPPNAFAKDQIKNIVMHDKNGDFVANGVYYKHIDKQIKAYTLTGVKDEQSILEKIRAIGTYIELKAAKANFAIDMDTYNRLVRNIIQAKKVDRTMLIDTYLLVSKQIPNLDINKYGMPLIASVVKDALMVESKVEVMLEGADVKNINLAKKGGLRARGGLMKAIIDTLNKYYCKIFPSNVSIEGEDTQESTWYSASTPDFC